MKKLIFSLAVCLCALTASAQDRWAVGGRFGSGLQAQGEYHFMNDNYLEARFGMYYANPGATVMADFTALYNWNICTMDWTPSAVNGSSTRLRYQCRRSRTLCLYRCGRLRQIGYQIQKCACSSLIRLDSRIRCRDCILEQSDRRRI